MPLYGRLSFICEDGVSRWRAADPASREREVIYIREAWELREGALFWRTRPDWHFPSAVAARRWNTWKAGERVIVQYKARHYPYTRCRGKKFYIHRVVWALTHGHLPTGVIDHINGDKCDFRIENLRTLTHAENMRNLPRAANNKSGVTGVRWDKRDRVWVAQVQYLGRYKYVGGFKKLEDAAAAVCAARAQLGFSEHHGREKCSS